MMASGEWKFPKTHESLPFWANNEDITHAIATLTGSGTDIKIYLGLSATKDGTYTFEEVTPGAQHNFVATGKWIKWRAVGVNYVLTKLEVDVNA